MTSVEMRNNLLFMRNEFHVSGRWEFPIIAKQDIPLDKVGLIAYANTKLNDTSENKRCGVHFFVDDYRFTGTYNNPVRSFDKLSQYAFLLSPDFSTYEDMNFWR